MVVCFVNLSSDYGGGENQTFLLASELLRKGVQIVSVVNPKSQLAKKFEELGIPVVLAKQPFAGHFSSTLRKITVVHAHDGRAVHWAAIHKSIFRTPYIVTRRVVNQIKNGFVTRWSYSGANELIGISEAICTILSKRVGLKNIKCIPDSPVEYPIDISIVEEIKKRYVGKFIVVQAGALRKHKAFDVSIQAAMLLANYKDIVFLFLGEGPEEQSLKKNASGLKNIEFLGKKTDMGNWFEVADCLILPSRKEGLGSVLLEAMQAEVPVIATNVGGITDLVKDHKTGLLIEPDDSELLAKKVLELYSNSDLRRRLSKNAKVFVRSLKIENTAVKYIEIYAKLSSGENRKKLISK